MRTEAASQCKLAPPVDLVWNLLVYRLGLDEVSALIIFQMRVGRITDVVSLALFCPLLRDVLERGLHAIELFNLLELLRGTLIKVWIFDYILTISAAARPAGSHSHAATGLICPAATHSVVMCMLFIVD